MGLGIRSKSEKNINLHSELYRQLGALHYGNISKIELDKVRENFNQAVKVLVETPTAPYLLQASNTAFEWATLEMAYGDWSCGQTLADWAIRTVGDLPPINPDFATYAAQYQSQKTRFVKRPGQPDQGCPKQQADWARS